MDLKPPFTEHAVSRGQSNLYARDYAGQGPAFVLMHGFPDNLHIYDDLVPYLVAAGRRVVTFDFLGFGASDKTSGAIYSFEQQLSDLEAVVDALVLGRIVPVGHDASGPAAINFAIAHPDSVSSICVLNAFYGAAPTAKLPELITLFATPGLHDLAMAIGQSPEQFGWLLQFQQKMFLDALPESQRPHFGAVLQPIVNDSFTRAPTSGPAFVQMTAQLFDEIARNTMRLPEMEALDTPVKLIWGENDPYFGRDVAMDFQSHLKHASVHIIPAGHWLQIDAPEQVAKEMLS